MNGAFFIEENSPFLADVQIRELPSSASDLALERRAELEQLLGVEEAARVLRSSERFELDEELITQLQLQGLAIQESGEIPSLSPRNWLKAAKSVSAEMWVEQGYEIVGLVLTKNNKKRFERFLSEMGNKQSQQPLQLLEIARHFFFMDSLKVAVRYTAPRLNRH